MYNSHPSPPSPPLPSPPPLTSPPSLPPPSLRPLPPTLTSPSSLPPLVTQQIHCPFQPKQSPSQHGFLKARSCLTIFCFFEEITKWVDEAPVDVIYLDFQKAFDKFPHQRLILKLQSHGMGNSIINWIGLMTGDKG